MPVKVTPSAMATRFDLVEQVVNGAMARRRHADALATAINDTISRAPVHVLPLPGGPWMNR